MQDLYDIVNILQGYTSQTCDQQHGHTQISNYLNNNQGILISNFRI